MRVGIYGGTFDPIHAGHLITAMLVRELRSLDKIIFVPCHRSPLRLNETRTDDRSRWEMTRLAIAGVPYFEASDFEMQRNEVSYTVDTLRYMKQRYGELELIIGEDQRNAFDLWKLPDEILAIAQLVVLKRNIPPESIRIHKYSGAGVEVQTPFIDISATMIRGRAAAGLPVDFLVPDAVRDYIKERGLYAGPGREAGAE